VSLLLRTPTILSVEGHTPAELKRLLTYRDLSVDFELRRLKKSYWAREKLGAEEFERQVAELSDQKVKCLLFEDDKGLWTYSGFAGLLSSHLGEQVGRQFDLPPSRTLEWATRPLRLPRPYQIQGNGALVQSVHGAVEIGTGLGKSFMALLLTKYHGQQAVIMAPSTNIAEQLHEDFCQAFGRSKVGFYGDGKKEMKLITVAISASLTRVEPGTKAYEFFSTAKVFIVDESHLVAAKTLQKICFGLMALAPYRYFFSGTQMRGDGADLLLKGITGDVKFEMSVKDGVDQGWLARPFFKMVKCKSDKRYYNEDANKMTRAHLYYNDEVNAIASDLANKSVQHLNQQVLVLVEELEQYQKLKPLLKFPSKFAHGPISKENLKYVPEADQRCDVKALVKGFNAREFPILVGTSCVSTGTDIQSVEHVIYLQGGKSEVGVRQAIGRGTRKIEGQGKTCFNFTDFMVECTAFDRETCIEKHARERARVYETVYPDSLQEVSCAV
jgi:superfamily II DNA or RNA helicase